MEKKQVPFRLFDVYLGTHRRKEDFFTYYLSSALDFCTHALDDKGVPVFDQILNDVLKIDATTEHLRPFTELRDVLKPGTFETIRAKFDFPGGSGPIIFREFPISIKGPGGGNLFEYLDIAFLLKKGGGYQFIGIEGKVTDRSVTPGQLERYFQNLKSMLTNPQSIEIKLYLLSIRDGNTTLARREADDYSEKRECISRPSLILWEHFDKPFKSVSDDYFAKAWEDAFSQIQQTGKMEQEKDQSGELNRFGVLKALQHCEPLQNAYRAFLQTTAASASPKQAPKGKETLDIVWEGLDDPDLAEQALLNLIQSTASCEDQLVSWEPGNRMEFIREKDAPDSDPGSLALKALEKALTELQGLCIPLSLIKCRDHIAEFVETERNHKQKQSKKEKFERAMANFIAALPERHKKSRALLLHLSQSHDFLNSPHMKLRIGPAFFSLRIRFRDSLARKVKEIALLEFRPYIRKGLVIRIETKK